MRHSLNLQYSCVQGSFGYAPLALATAFNLLGKVSTNIEVEEQGILAHSSWSVLFRCAQLLMLCFLIRCSSFHHISSMGLRSGDCGGVSKQRLGCCSLIFESSVFGIIILLKSIAKSQTHFLSTLPNIFRMFIYISSSVLCSRAGPSLQTQGPRLQFCPKAGLPLQTQEPRLQFY